MNLSLLAFLTKRYLLSQSEDHFISFISKISMAGITLGITVLIIVLSMMNGFAEEFKSRILGNIPQVLVSARQGEGLDNWQDLSKKLHQEEPLIQSISPARLTSTIVLSDEGGGSFVQTTGILPEHLEAFNSLEHSMTLGSLKSLKPRGYKVVIGRLLANSLDVVVGDSIRLVVPKVRIGLTGTMPRIREFQVVGLFDTNSEIDKNYILTNLEDLNALVGKPREAVPTLSIRYQDVLEAPIHAKSLQARHPSLFVTDWSQVFGSLYSAISMEKRMVALLLFSVILVASFNVLATLVMIVKEKRGEIAVLRTMGAHRKDILLIFFIQGVSIGLIGSVLGLVFGVLGALTISDLFLLIESVFGVHLLDANTYFINYLPSKLQLSDVLQVLIGAMAVASLATLYPAYRASSIAPADILRS